MIKAAIANGNLKANINKLKPVNDKSITNSELARITNPIISENKNRKITETQTILRLKKLLCGSNNPEFILYYLSLKS
jgi:hypothetical protein